MPRSRKKAIAKKRPKRSTTDVVAEETTKVEIKETYSDVPTEQTAPPPPPTSEDVENIKKSKTKSVDEAIKDVNKTSKKSNEKDETEKPSKNKPSWMSDDLDEDQEFMSYDQLDKVIEEAAEKKDVRQETLRELAASAKRNIFVGTYDVVDATDPRVVLPDFQMQRLFNQRFLPSNRILEIMGEEESGKSTMAFKLLTTFAKQGCHGLYCMSESKLPPDAHIQRVTDRRPETWERMKDSGIIEVSKTNNTLQFEDTVLSWMKACRGYDKKEATANPKKPLFIVLDSFSKLQPANEARGKSSYGELSNAANAKKMQNAGEGSNFGLAKWSHAFIGRTWATLAAEYNAFLIVLTHQNDDVDMGASFLPAAAMKLNNDTSVGGKALKQSAAYRWLMIKSTTEKVKTTGDVVATNTKIKVIKNSYGNSNIVVPMKIKRRYTLDTDEYLEDSLSFSEGFAEDCAKFGWLGTTVSNKRYTCERIGADSVTHDKFYDAFLKHKGARLELGKEIGIDGYQY